MDVLRHLPLAGAQEGTPSAVRLPLNEITRDKKIFLLGSGSELKTRIETNGSAGMIAVEIPGGFRKRLPYKHTLTFKLIK